MAAMASRSAPLALEGGAGLHAAAQLRAGLRHLRAAKSLDPESKEVQEAMQKGEKTMREELERAGHPDLVPKLAISMIS